MKLASLLILAAFFCAAPALLSAEDPLAGKRIDLDGDGKIEREELRLALDAELASLDKDHDGKLDRKEAREALHRIKEKLEKDMDGKLESGELRSELRKLKEHHPILYARVLGHIRAHRGLKK